MFKELPANAGDKRDLGSVSGLGRSPGEGNGNPLQYSCLKNPVDRGTWLGYSPWCRKESDTTERLSTTRVLEESGSPFYRMSGSRSTALSKNLFLAVREGKILRNQVQALRSK